ncbi:MAG: DUF2309 domain-containing protein [Thiohalocapsa sp.]|nr:DUF2309 domain-containing protein [Thiohalocapsa sp.]
MSTTARNPSDDAAAEDAPGLGKRLKIRSMVSMAGEFLPFFWPMRSFIHHNPLHGLEYLPFEQAVEQATRLFHARGYLPRAQYQRFLREGSIDSAVLEALVDDFVADWRSRQTDDVDDAETAELRQVLLVLLTHMDQPTPGSLYPSTEDILRCLLADAEAADNGVGGRR